MPKEKITLHGKIVFGSMFLAVPGFLLNTLAPYEWGQWGPSLMTAAGAVAMYAVTSNKPLSVPALESMKLEANWGYVAKLEHSEGYSHTEDTLRACEWVECQKLWREYQEATYPEQVEMITEVRELTPAENAERIKRKVDEMTLQEAIDEYIRLNEAINAAGVSVTADDLHLRNELERTLLELQEGLMEREKQESRPIDVLRDNMDHLTAQMIMLGLSPVAQVMSDTTPSPVSEYLASGYITPNEARYMGYPSPVTANEARQHETRKRAVKMTDQERRDYYKAEAAEAFQEYKKNPDGDPLKRFIHRNIR